MIENSHNTSRYRFVIGGMTLLGHLAVGLNVFAISPILPLAIDDYGINRTTAGLLVSLPMLVAAIFGLPGGMLLPKVGVYRAFLLAWAAIGILAFSAIAPSFPVMILLRLVYGLGLALMLTATGPMLMHWFRPKEVLVMNALNTALLSLGIAVSVTLAAPLAEVFAWRMVLTIFALIGVPGVVAWFLLGKPTQISTAPADSVPFGTSLMSSFQEVGVVLRNRAVVLLLAADAGVLVQYTSLTGWLPTFYSEERGISLSEAGLITGILPLVGFFAVLAGGAIPLRLRSPNGLFVGAGLLAGLGGLGAFLLPNVPAIYAAVVVLGIGSWIYVPMLLTLPLQLKGMTPERISVVYGSFLTFSGIGMFVAPVLVGALRDTSGSFLPGFAICAAASWALLLSGVLLPSSSREAKPGPAVSPAQD